MLPLAAVVLAFMVSVVPVARHSSFEPEHVTEARYLAIAGDIATAAEESPAPGLDATRTAVLLASVASYESSFAASVDACQRRGGTKSQPAFTLWQMAGRRDLCASRLDAARAAVALIGESLSRCHAEPLSFFTKGQCLPSDDAAHWRYLRARTWWLHHDTGPRKEAS